VPFAFVNWGSAVVAKWPVSTSVVVSALSSRHNLKDFVEASMCRPDFHFAAADSGGTPYFLAEMRQTCYGAKRIPVHDKSSAECTKAVEKGFVELKIARWGGFQAPSGGPLEIMDKMVAAMDAALNSAPVTERLQASVMKED
jgi:hypothetical protein